MKRLDTKHLTSWPLWMFPCLKLTIQLTFLRGYGIFRDELYYIACSKRLAWGYVDHPPLSIAILRLVRETLGESLWALRVLPAVAGAVTLLLIGLITRRLGGGTLAQALAMTAALAVPTYWGVAHIYSMNVFDSLVWAVTAYLVIRIADGAGTRVWLALGMVLGLGLLNKLSVLWLGFGLGVGLLATQQRRSLASKGPWLAAGLAALVFAPHIVWQIRHGWPTHEFIANATGEKMVAVSALDFVRGQADMLGGWLMPLIALIGLIYLLSSGAGQRFRILGWMYLAVFVLLLANGTSRAGYLAPAYVWLLAAGGLALARLLERLPRPAWRVLATAALFGLFAIQGALAAPFALPILPVDRYIAYARALGVAPSTEERKELGALPQFYADMHGWEEKARAARRAVEGLSPSERAAACFFTWNYGVAGAIEHLGGPTLPPTISGHNNYWLWGPGPCTGDILIVMGGRAETLRQRYASVEQVDTVRCGHCMPYENHQAVYIARGRRGGALADIWDQAKHYD